METRPKSRFARLMVATLVGSVALGAVGAAFAKTDKDAAALEALGQAQLTLADAIRVAEAANQGIVTGAEFEPRPNGAYFDVTTQSGTTEIDHRIDPATGTVLASAPDMEEPGSDDDDAAEEAQELAALQGAQVTLLQAVSAAADGGAVVLEAEYAYDDDRLAIELKVAEGPSNFAERLIDAATGQVIVDADASDHGDDVDDED